MLKSFCDVSSIHYENSELRSPETKEIEKRLMILEEENKQLRKLFRYKSEMEQLMLELNCSNTLKHKYQHMYNEVAVKLMYLQNADSLIYEETEQLGSLTRKTEILTHANDDLRQIIEEKAPETRKLENENEFLSSHTVPMLTQGAVQLEIENLQLEKTLGIHQEIQKRNVTVSTEDSHISVNSGTVKTNPCREREKLRFVGVDSVVTLSGMSKKHTKTQKSPTKHLYLPSFLRNKRTPKKGTPQLNQKAH